ncbi:MAG: NAD-dependent epimerase/dehydratase family protein, partial [candidate division WOR-3 bacterium]|nr:NAD-dependent epimerase/dehydratase family protein [candidate division WOR-3 bacterium]
MGRVLVTGANGFIGSHLVEALLENGYQVRALVRRTSNLNWLAGLPIEFAYGTVTDINSLLPAIDNIDFICHTAGITKAKDADEYALVNYGGTENLLKACLMKKSNLKRFVHISSLS